MKYLRFHFVFLLSAPLIFSRAETSEVLKLLNQPQHYALIRHALAPGTGDPSIFDLKDCSTQRNLSETGRKQAKEMGTLFRKHGMEEAEVFSSQWCRCVETAERLNLGKVQELPALNSFFGRPQKKKPQLESLGTWFENHSHSKPTLLITHQVVITSLTGVFPASGEIVVIRVESDGGIKVMGRIQTM